MNKEKILIIEDDIHLSNIIKTFLSNDGYEIRQEFTGENLKEILFSFSPDLVILDLMLPKSDGIELCKKIRDQAHIPIIIISAKNSDYDKVLALGVGADDYLTKPFSQIELVARVKSQLRRVREFSTPKVITEEIKTFGELKINPSSYRVTVKNKEIDFSPKEFALLDFLSSHPGQVFKKEILIDYIWGFNEYIDENTIAVYVGRIREKLQKEGGNFIKTVWGVGYKWDSQ
ncbi:MAG: response regulator [Clostridium sp.]